MYVLIGIPDDVYEKVRSNVEISEAEMQFILCAISVGTKMHVDTSKPYIVTSACDYVEDRVAPEMLDHEDDGKKR